MKLRRGEIKAQGKLLPPGVSVIDFVEEDNSYGRSDFADLPDTSIPLDFWTMAGIDWIANAVSARGRCYCDVSMSVAPLMSVFPGSRTPVGRAEFVGDYLLIKESDEEDGAYAPPKRALGRPAVFGWDAFHVEVADLIKSGRMPQKKEAAISAHAELVRGYTRKEAKPFGRIGKANPVLQTVHLRKTVTDDHARSKGPKFSFRVAPVLPQLEPMSIGEKSRRNHV